MSKLYRAIYGVQIHGRTGQEVTKGWMEPGVEYEYEGLAGPEVFGEPHAIILVEGYRYRVLASEIAEARTALQE